MSFFEILLIVWQIIRNQHKTIIFCQISNAVIYLFVILYYLLRISILQLDFEQISKQKTLIQRTFQKNFKKEMILMIIFDVDCTNWNFQKRCHHVHFFESIYNNVTKNQTLIRVRRFDNSIKMIYLYHYFVEKTWTSFNVVKNIRKCIFEATTLLNKEIFENVENETNEKIDIENWVWCDEKLFDARDFHVLNQEFSIFTSIELLIKMMKIRIDEFVETK